MIMMALIAGVVATCVAAMVVAVAVLVLVALAARVLLRHGGMNSSRLQRCAVVISLLVKHVSVSELPC